MKILMIGAGVLGSLYAARLQQSGQDVTILARGARLSEIRAHGLVLIEDRSQKETVARVQVTDHLAADEPYDLVVVLVRKNQLASVLPMLAQNHYIPQILLMVNNAAGPDEIARALGQDRVLLGFPGAGGQRDGHKVRYRLVSKLIQPTMIGELSGQETARIQAIAQMLRAAGFPVAISSNMRGWLQTHAALVSPIANAIYQANGSNYILAHSPDILRAMIRSIREQFQVLHSLKIAIMPARYRLIAWLPEVLLVALCRVGFNTPQAELVLTRHANAARDEMAQIANELADLARAAQIKTPYSEALALLSVEPFCPKE